MKVNQGMGSPKIKCPLEAKLREAYFQASLALKALLSIKIDVIL
jgi:hypothetical protein